MNVLMLDEERVIVSKGEDTLTQPLKDWASSLSSAISTILRRQVEAFIVLRSTSGGEGS